MMLDEILNRLDVQLPIFQAPIGSVASPELAAAVSNAGAVGHLACTWRSPEQLHDLFATMDRLTKKAYGANFVLDFDVDRQLDVALDHNVPMISFFWGNGARYVQRVKARGSVAIQVAGSIREAHDAAEAGFDIIVAQGREAGGHVRGRLGLMALLPQIVDAVSPLPVVAAGGIADRRGVAAALALGASGVWVGTRFLAANEANIHPVYRERVLASSGDDTLYSEIFDIGWPNAPLRTIRNSTTRLWELGATDEVAHGAEGAPSSRPGATDVVARRADGTPIPRYHFGSPTREVEGDVEAMALYAGEAVGLVRSKTPASEIVADLAAGFGARGR
jgi:nitronate monooxygenase